MTRLSFLLGILGVKSSAEVGYGTRVPGTRMYLQRVKPKNNECPVCGTMATPFTREKWAKDVNSRYACAGTPAGSSMCSQATPEDAPKSNLIRCAYCSAAFWQDTQSEGHAK